jgi:hypothetical protein
MGHQRLVVSRELLRVAVVMDGQRHPVRPMPLGHTAQGPQGVLPTATEARKTLRKTDRHVFPIRVRQHEVINQMVQGHALDGYVQVVHPGEIGGRQAPGRVLLGEEDLLARSVLRLPLTHAPFQRASHRGRILARTRLLEPVP